MELGKFQLFSTFSLAKNSKANLVVLFYRKLFIAWASLVYSEGFSWRENPTTSGLPMPITFSNGVEPFRKKAEHNSLKRNL